MADSIRFYHQGAVRSIDRVAPTRTVLQYLREDVHCTGTKEGCAEGDCGACTVVVGELRDGAIELKTVNACLQLLPTLDGKALFTIEDLKQPNGELHPVQQALVDCHASQCGFCTPGFAMSLWSLYLQHAPLTLPLDRKTIDCALSGNLCRCTGYRPIIDAARHMLDLPAVTADHQPVIAALNAIRREQGLRYQYDGQMFHAPRAIQQLTELCGANPDACLVAGATDVGLWITKQMRALGDIIYLGEVAELKTVSENNGMLEIGAGVSLEQAYGAICAHYPSELGELWQRFASLPIRNIGTLGGNLANGSPIGDSAPWMIALGAEIVLHGASGERCLPLEDFYLDYQKKDLRRGEFVAAMRIPLPHAGLRFRTYKLAKRYDQDISAVCAAFSFNYDNDVICNVRIAFGGMAATSRRAGKTEAALDGKPWNEASLQAATAMLAQDYAPLTDMRASSAYRMRAAQNLLRRFWLETRLDAPLAAEALNVFADGRKTERAT